MKTANFFHGDDTYGRHINVCIRREDSQMFWRSYSYNGYANAWTKWDKIENMEVFDNCGEPAIKWGFNILNGFYYKGIRPPKYIQE